MKSLLRLRWSKSHRAMREMLQRLAREMTDRRCVGRVARYADRPARWWDYFLLRIKPSQQSLQQSKKQMTITPGMPAEVMIAIGERRAFEYFLTPLKERMTHAFREE